MKNGNVWGPDEMPVEVLKLSDDNCIQFLVTLFNDVYETSEQHTG